MEMEAEATAVGSRSLSISIRSNLSFSSLYQSGLTQLRSDVCGSILYYRVHHLKKILFRGAIDDLPTRGSRVTVVYCHCLSLKYS